jgi:2'-5' RNA ligase
VRLFIAIEIEDDAKRAIARLQRRLAEAIGQPALRWTEPEQMHVTLVFLGEVASERVDAIARCLTRLGHEEQPQSFDVSLGGGGVFPARGAPRVLWLGLTGGAPMVTRLQMAVARRLSDLNREPCASAVRVDAEKRGFHPHITLARWPKSRPGDGRRAIEALGVASGPGGTRTVGRTHVDAVTLFQSRPSPQRGVGPSYIPLERVTLK